MNNEQLQKTLETITQQLAEQSKQFGFIGKKFEDIDKRFDLIDQRFDAIDKRFEAVDQRFDTMEKKFEAMDDQFNRLYLYVEDRLNKLEAALATKADKADLDRYVQVLDADLKKREIDEQERLAMSHQLEKLTERVAALEAHYA